MISPRQQQPARQQPLLDVLKQLEERHGVVFDYNRRDLRDKTAPSDWTASASLDVVLPQLLTPNGLTFEKNNSRSYLIYSRERRKLTPNPPSSATSPPALKQELLFKATADQEIRGRVTDKNTNETLPGVSVVVKGTSRGTTTDAKGDYQLTLPEASAGSELTLVFSFIGYEKLEVAAGNRTRVDAAMSLSETLLNDVVVIAYGSTKRITVSNSIASVSAKDFADKPVSTAGEALAGLLPGVTVDQGVGQPGVQPQIKVRGTASLSAGSTPLYVIDGVPQASADNFGQLNPADIQSIDVLKDAAAAAIYGSRGGNGVVLVTTKKGKSGKPTISLNTYTGVQSVAKYIDLLNKEQYIDYVKDAFTNGNRTLPAVFNTPDALANTDWQREIFRTAPMSNVQLSASGGTDNVNYFISAGYLTQDGILRETGYKRYNFRSNIAAKLTSWARVGVNLAPSFSINNVRPTAGTVNSATTSGINFGPSPSAGAAITLAILAPPVTPVFLPNGDYASIYNFPQGRPFNTQLQFNGQNYNPLASLTEVDDVYKSLRTTGNAYLELEPVKGLTLRTSFGGEFIGNSRKFFVPGTFASDANTLAAFSNPILANVQNALAKGNTSTWVFENTANYKKTFKSSHNVDLLLGYAAQKSVTENTTVTSAAGTATSFSVQYPTNGTSILGSPFFTSNSLVSYFGRAQYDYNAKYLLSAAIRRDGSSRFGVDNQFAVFPSFSAGWNVSEEEFFKGLNTKTLSSLKLRGSWGKTGNFNIGDYATQAYQLNDNYVFGAGQGTLATGYAQGNFALNNLTWETNTQTDLGLEVGLFNDRIFFTGDVYNRKTEGLLLSKNVPRLIGFTTSVLTNVGEIRNRGLELALITQNFVGKFRWTSNFNISFNRNKIISLVDQSPILFDVVGSPGYQNLVRATVGGSLGDFWGYRQVGVYLNAADVAAGPVWGTGGSAPGDIKYADTNGDGRLNASDITYLGSPLPKFTYGFVNTMSYRGFDLSLTVDGSYGGLIANAINRYSNTNLGGNNLPIAALNRWRSEGDPGDGMTPRALNPGNASPSALSQFSTRNLFSSSFFRLRTATLGYNLEQIPYKKLGLSAARIYVTAQNLFTLATYPGYNPQVNTFGTLDAPRFGIDQGAYPVARTFIVGLNISF